MRGLNPLPSQKDRLLAYNLLQANSHARSEAFHKAKQRPISESDIIQFAQWSRFDPRLGEVLLSFLFQHWIFFDAMKLRKLNLVSAWPQALAVIFDHLVYTAKNSPQKMAEPSLIFAFTELITNGIEPVSYQSYTVGVFKFAGKELKSRAELPHPLFKKWGFYERDLLLPKNIITKTRTSLDRHTRKRILTELLRRRKEITVSDYLEACRHLIHRRQAERDLHDFFRLKKRGQTRRCVYFL